MTFKGTEIVWDDDSVYVLNTKHLVLIRDDDLIDTPTGRMSSALAFQVHPEIFTINPNTRTLGVLDDKSDT